MQSELVDTATGETLPLPVATIADKCVWTADDSAIYCGIPVNPSAGLNYPDDWYQGAVSFSDRIWRIQVSGRYAQLVLDFPAEAKSSLDAVALALVLVALETLARAKAEGLVRAVGVSSHSRLVLTRLLDLQAVDVALAVVNQTGSWMKDATPKEMTDAVKRLYRSGRGVYGIKALGSGQVAGQAEVAAALRYAFRYPYVHATCVGMTSESDLEANVALWRRARVKRRPISPRRAS